MRDLKHVTIKSLQDAIDALNEMEILPAVIRDQKKLDLAKDFIEACNQVPEEEEENLPDAVVDMFNFLVSEPTDDKDEGDGEEEAAGGLDETAGTGADEEEGGVEEGEPETENEETEGEETGKTETEEKTEGEETSEPVTIRRTSRTSKKKKYDRIKAFVDAVKEGPGTMDELIERSHEFTIKNGLKKRPDGAKWYANYVIRVLEAFDLAVEDEETGVWSGPVFGGS